MSLPLCRFLCSNLTAALCCLLIWLPSAAFMGPLEIWKFLPSDKTAFCKDRARELNSRSRRGGKRGQGMTVTGGEEGGRPRALTSASLPLIYLAVLLSILVLPSSRGSPLQCNSLISLDLLHPIHSGLFKSPSYLFKNVFSVGQSITCSEPRLVSFSSIYLYTYFLNVIETFHV